MEFSRSAFIELIHVANLYIITNKAINLQTMVQWIFPTINPDQNQKKKKTTPITNNAIAKESETIDFIKPHKMTITSLLL